MPAIVIVGAQWGDEGKGKIVDIYTERADMVVRFGGGPNAGHTLVVGDDKLVVRLVPSGILRAETTCVLAQGMVIDPRSLVTELDELERRGIKLDGRLLVSDRAHVIFPYHVLIDGLREKGKDAIGTTKRGVGPCYEDKVARRGIPLGAFRDPKRLRELVGRALADWAPIIQHLGGGEVPVPSVDEVLAAIEPTRARIVPMLVDSQALVERTVRARQEGRPRGRAGHAARRRSRHVSVRHVVDADRGRRVRRRGHRPDAHRRGRRSREGVHDARRRRPVPDRAPRRRRRAHPQGRRRVRLGHGPPASYRAGSISRRSATRCA